MSSHYIRRDGNGGVNVSYSVLVTILALFSIAGYVINTVTAYNTIQNDISSTNKEVAVLEKRIEKDESSFDAAKSDHEARLQVCEKNSAVIGTQLQTLNTNMVALQKDIKEMSQALYRHMGDTPGN